MPEISANITVQNVDLTVETTDTNINITPTAVQLSVYGGGFAPAGGANAQLQYNDNGRLAGTSNFYYFNGNVITGDDNFKILGGNNGYFLQTDGLGNLTWYPGTAFPTGNGTVGGANTQIQFNNQGNFGGAAGFTFNPTNLNINMPNNLQVTSNVTANYFIGNGSQLTGVGTPNEIFNGTSNVSIPTSSGNIFGYVNANRVLLLSNNQVAIGQNAQANANGIAIGTNSTANNINSIAIGMSSNAAWSQSVAIMGTTGNGVSYTLGGNAQGQGAMALGFQSRALANNTIAIGSSANASATNSIVLNASSTALVTTTSNTFNVKPIRQASTANVLYYDNVSGEISYSSLGVSSSEISNGSSNVRVFLDGNVTISLAGFANVVNFNSSNISTSKDIVVSGGITATNFFGNGGNLTNLNGANVTGFVPNAAIANTVRNAAQPNITSVGTLTSLSVSGNITSSGIITGNGSGLTSLTGANVNGQVANALVAGTVYTAAQPNITSVGTLTSLSVSGTITANNLVGNIAGPLANGNSNISIPVANGNINFTVNGVETANISSNRLTVSDLRVNATSLLLGANAAFAPNTWAGAVVLGEGATALSFAPGLNPLIPMRTIAIGYQAKSFGSSVVIGDGAGTRTTANFYLYNVAIGAGAQGGTGSFVDNNYNQGTVAIGVNAGFNNQNTNAIAIGFNAGFNNQGARAIAIGGNSGNNSPSNSISIGHSATVTGTGGIAMGAFVTCANGGVAIGASSSNNSVVVHQYSSIGIAATTGNGAIVIGAMQAARDAIAMGYNSRAGNNSITIGANSTSNGTAPNNLIVLNATGNNWDLTGPDNDNKFLVKPVRNVTGEAGFFRLVYNPTTGEIGYSTT